MTRSGPSCCTAAVIKPVSPICSKADLNFFENSVKLLRCEGLENSLYAIKKMEQIDDVMIYGDIDPGKVRRTGALAFNIRGFDHSLTAAILNDYFNIAERNACFCVHPYVREMITDELSIYAGQLSDEELEALAEPRRGMVRASFGLYNNESDVDALVSALRHICSNKHCYQDNYQKAACGEFHHNTFRFDSHPIFSVQNEVNHWFGA
jgi:cysteine desulfurase/selenocysteine lyase